MSVDSEGYTQHRRLKHGEVLRNVVEFVSTGEGDGIPNIVGVTHDLVIVLTPECDLVSDYGDRNETGASSVPEDGKLNRKTLPRVQCCDLFLYSQIREPYEFTNRPWTLVKDNRDERYHRVPSEDIPNFDQPELFLDFRRLISVPTGYLYGKLRDGSIERCGTIPSPWINHLVQRCYRFQSRVCVPDPSDPRPS